MAQIQRTLSAIFGLNRSCLPFIPGVHIVLRLICQSALRRDECFASMKRCRCSAGTAHRGRCVVKALLLPLLFIGLVGPRVLASPVPPEIKEPGVLLQARELTRQGKFAQVMQVLEPWVQDQSGTHDEISVGEAWGLLGPAYETLDRYDAARRAYEASIRLLRTHPAAHLTYANALVNLGSLEIFTGSSDAAGSLLRQAEKLYIKAVDHAGLAEIATTRAILALDRNDQRAAHRYLANALLEAQQAEPLTDGDWAEICSIKGVLAARDRNFSAALVNYQQSVEFWIRARGPDSELVALQYILQADAYRELRNYMSAESHVIQAMRTLEKATGSNTSAYAAAEFAYARLLRATDRESEAAQKEREANALMKATRAQRCAQCSVSVESLR
jgi:tetratricopeptide (TPR) repeat protein